MATIASPPPGIDPSKPVPLDTIPISPADGDTEGLTEKMGNTNLSLDENVTVFHDPDNFNVKHPLMHEWTLWFTKPSSGKVDFH